FTPSGGIPVADFSGVGLAAFTLAFHDAGDGAAPGDTVFDVDTGEITSGAAVIRPATTGDPSIRDVQSAVAYRQTSSNMAVFTFGSLSVPSGTTLKLVGTRAVAIASSSTITIDGVVEARPMTPDGTEICGPSQGVAPGGFAGGIGEILGHQGAYSAPTPGGGPGGGGGGMAAPGGGGGHASGGGAGCNPGDVADSSAACGSAGTTYDVAQLDQSDFHGGAGGGGGGVILPPYHQGAGGGNGGGAIRLVAVSSLEVSGRIDASGCGGLAGSIGLGCASGTPLQDCPPGSTITAGGGGGAGGAIVLEAPRIQLGPSAAIYAMGGAGGSPVSPGGSSEGNAGCEEGVPGDTHASAGAGSVANAAYDAGAQSGLFPGCGGGGAFGWIRINAGGGNVATAASATLNPPLGNAAVSIGALSP
ncbi:MAG TPA: hypothetical protein VN894_02815, partial [Polyangiaceae bacterium]|nr:hypothetical protein [Polyangiaceae bacterium]